MEALAVWGVPPAMWPLGLALAFGVAAAPEADLPGQLKVVMKQERVAATAPGVEVLLQSEVVSYQEALSVPREFGLVLAPGLAQVWEVPMALEAGILP
jgi:hypothetical protein